MTKKGKLEEIISWALYNDNADVYWIGYRDFKSIAWLSLPEFLSLSQNFQLIPASRILLIKRKDEIIYERHIKNNQDNNNQTNRLQNHDNK